MWWAFETFLIGHIIFGGAGLLMFWVPVATRKGAAVHRRWGLWFIYSMLVTGTLATGMSLCTLIAPLETHPKLDDPVMIRGLFGSMMLYLAVLTISLAWHSLKTIRNKLPEQRDRGPFDVGLQVLVIVLALNCAVHGFLIGQPIMMGIAIVGIASGLTNLVYLYRSAPGRLDFMKEHVKAGVGAGISVYTAFLAFGAVRIMPSQAFNPIMWAAPIVIGISLILYHHRRITLGRHGRMQSAAE